MSRRRRFTVGGVIALVVAVIAPTWWFVTSGSSSVPLPPTVVITPAKTAVIVGEPLSVRVALSNPGTESTTVNVHPSIGFQGLSFSVAQGVGAFRPYVAPTVRAGGLQGLELSPVTLAPGQTIERDVVLFFNLFQQDFPFPAAGAFKLRATLFTTPGDAATGINSNTVDITASNATGTAATALDFLRTHSLGPLLTAAAVYELESRFKVAEMKSFVDTYPSTPYTPFVQEAFDATCAAFPPFCASFVATGTVVGRVVNATTSAGIDHVVVTLRPRATGSSPPCSDPTTVLSTSTDPTGAFEFDLAPVGAYDLTASVAGFTTGCRGNITMAAGATTTVNLSLSSSLGPGQLRLVLTWGPSPSDLNAHLWLPPVLPYHLWAGRPGDQFGCPFSKLERNDTDGFGPESVLIQQAFPGTFVYAVNRFAGAGTIVGSGATVEVYSVSGLVATFQPPATGTGDWWYVLTFSSSTGVTAVNTIQPLSPAPYPDTDSGCSGGGGFT